MKLRLRRHETRKIVELELANTCTLYDLRRRIYPWEPSYVHLLLHRNNELLAHSPETTLRSLGVTSDDLIHYSIDHYSFYASVQDIGLASSCEAHQALVSNGEYSGGKLGKYATLGLQSNWNLKFAHKSIDFDVNLNLQGLNPGVEDQAEGSTRGKLGMKGPEPMNVKLVSGKRKRLSDPFFLKHVLLENSGDTNDLNTLAISVHAVMLESGFLLLDPDSDRFSFSKELLSISLRYTLPELISRNDTNTIESVTLKFQNLGYMVVVYGSLGGSKGHMFYLDKRKFIPVIDLVMDTLKYDKQGYSSFYREVFTFWRMVKDGLIIPLMIDLCDKAGLEPPPCLMSLPTDLKLKILESLPGASVAKMACVCTEMRHLASDNDLWKQKCLEESKNIVMTESGSAVDWKQKFAALWRRVIQVEGLKLSRRSRIRYFRMLRNPETWLSEDWLPGF